jgi:hypothetical protein
MGSWNVVPVATPHPGPPPQSGRGGKNRENGVCLTQSGRETSELTLTSAAPQALPFLLFSLPPPFVGEGRGGGALQRSRISGSKP